jgi:hypothetical protein
MVFVIGECNQMYENRDRILADIVIVQGTTLSLHYRGENKLLRSRRIRWQAINHGPLTTYILYNVLYPSTELEDYDLIPTYL